MKLTKIELIEFKGINNKEINLINNISFLVSENNVGKTRILESIKAFYDRIKEIHIKISFNVTDTEKEELKTELSDDNLENKYRVNASVNPTNRIIVYALSGTSEHRVRQVTFPYGLFRFSDYLNSTGARLR